jgi:RimJ/RimL family protein N-acetyltransferase
MRTVQPLFIVPGRQLYLSPLDPGDAADCARWVNSEQLRPYLNRPWEITEEDERQRIETLVSSPNAVGFALRMNDTDQLIGRSAIWNIHKVNMSCLFTIFLGETEMQSRGLGSEATALTTIYAMDELKLHRIELESFVYNERALRCYEKLGFRREGVRREAKYHDGKFHDAVQMSILADEWQDGLRAKHREHLDPAWAGGPPQVLQPKGR